MIKDRSERARQLVGLCLGLPPEELEADLQILLSLLQLRLETPTTTTTIEVRLYEHPKTPEQLAAERAAPPLKLVKPEGTR